MAELRSIHYRRRWYYALWVALLVSSGIALALWERPSRIDLASLVFRVEIRNVPAGTRMQAWNGPWAQWQGAGWTGEGVDPIDIRPDGTAAVPLVRIRIARRRWVQDYIPRDTWDLMVLRLTPPSGLPRYFIQPLSADIRRGELKAGWRLTTTASFDWDSLRTDATLPEREP